MSDPLLKSLASPTNKPSFGAALNTISMYVPGIFLMNHALSLISVPSWPSTGTLPVKAGWPCSHCPGNDGLSGYFGFEFLRTHSHA